MTMTGTTSEMCTETDNLLNIVKSDELAAGDGEKGTPYTVYFRAWNRKNPKMPVFWYKFHVGVAAEKNNCLEEPSEKVNLLEHDMNVYLPYDSSIVALGTCIYSIGGCHFNSLGASNGCPTTLVYRYNTTQPKSGWVSITPMQHRRSKQGYVVIVDTNPRVLAVDGKIYVMGGLSEVEYAKDDIANKWAEVYDPKTGEWSDVTVACASDGYEKNPQPLFAFLLDDVFKNRDGGVEDYFIGMRIEALGSYKIFLAAHHKHYFIMDTRKNVLRRIDDRMIFPLSPYVCAIMKETDGETDGFPDHYYLDWSTGCLEGTSTKPLSGSYYHSDICIYDGGRGDRTYLPRERMFFTSIRTFLQVAVQEVQDKNDRLQIHVLFKEGPEDPFVVHYKHIEYHKVNLVKGAEGSIYLDGNIKSHKTYKLACAEEVYLDGGVVLPFVLTGRQSY